MATTDTTLPDTAPAVPTIERHVVWSPRYRFGYYRVPKAANSSIRFILAKKLRLSAPESLRPNNDAFWTQLPADQARLMTPADFLADPDTGRGWSFTFVRHPVARLYSCWNNKVIENTGEMSRRFTDMGVTRGMGFAEFVDRVAAAPDDSCDIHVRSQTAILTLDGHVLPDFVGRVENITADWKHIRYEIQMRSGLKLGPMQQRNVRNNTQADVMFDMARPVRRKILDRYLADFEMFYPSHIRKMRAKA